MLKPFETYLKTMEANIGASADVARQSPNENLESGLENSAFQGTMQTPRASSPQLTFLAAEV